jgi:hypothetical protein
MPIFSDYFQVLFANVPLPLKNHGTKIKHNNNKSFSSYTCKYLLWEIYKIQRVIKQQERQRKNTAYQLVVWLSCDL